MWRLSRKQADQKSIQNFKSNIPATKTALEVVYSDVCGLMEPVSLWGNHYINSFLDDFTRKLCVYLIKRKGEAFEVFKHIMVIQNTRVV
jgi:hypothetical protein